MYEVWLQKALLYIGHENVPFFCKDIRILDDDLCCYWKEEVILLQVFFIDGEGAPALGVIIEKTQGFIIIEVEC